MATFLNISGDEHTITYGVETPVTVPDGGAFEVADDAARNYAVQPEMWEPADEAAHAAVMVPEKKPAAKAKGKGAAA